MKRNKEQKQGCTNCPCTLTPGDWNYPHFHSLSLVLSPSFFLHTHSPPLLLFSFPFPTSPPLPDIFLSLSLSHLYPSFFLPPLPPCLPLSLSPRLLPSVTAVCRLLTAVVCELLMAVCESLMPGPRAGLTCILRAFAHRCLGMPYPPCMWMMPGRHCVDSWLSPVMLHSCDHNAAVPAVGCVSVMCLCVW